MGGISKLSLAGLLGFGVAGCLSASVLNVTGLVIPATAEIFSSGQAAPNDPEGALPISVTGFTAGAGNVMTITSVSGSVKACIMVGCNSVGADGGNALNGAPGTNLALTNSGLSSYQFTGNEMALVGVFLTNSVPSGAGPASMGDYGQGGLADSATFSPQIGQVFFIGDGLTGTNNSGGTVQQFNVPLTATRLFLGFADGGRIFVGSDATMNTQGQAGAYGDNVGSLTASLAIGNNLVPEPGTITLMALGIAALAFGRKKLSA